MKNDAVLNGILHKPWRYLIAKSGSGTQDEWLPVWTHLMDTAGIMELLLTQWLPQRHKGHLEESEWIQVCTFLALIHDIGKFTPVFQSKITATHPECTGMLEHFGWEIPKQTEFNEPGKTPHGLAGEAILCRLGCQPGIAAVVGAHHGRPQEIVADVEGYLEIYEDNFFGITGERSHAGKKWNSVWEEWLTIALQTCGYASVDDLPQLDIPTQVLAAGLVIMSDWIASNTYYFPLLEMDDAGNSLSYPERVQEAWKRLSLPPPWTPGTYYMGVHDFQERFGFTWNVVQQYMIQAIEESAAPGIFILEAPMGAGKTEAALAGAELLSSCLGQGGIFFGMPTQATANGIFPRLKQWSQRQSEWAQHGIRLAHGMAEMNEDYQSIFHGHAMQNEDETASGLIVHPWFEGRKQALLSEFVIGTVDQLLMAALKQKHVMLRHLGLASKVIIVDECHAYDAYMNRYLDRALSWLGAYRVPLVLLSATLPSKRRKELIHAYQNIHLQCSTASSWQDNQAYPLLTWTDGSTVRQQSIPVDQPSRIICIQQTDRLRLISQIEKTASLGGCIGIIMNTVKQAQELAKEIKQTFSEHSVILLHSRLLMADRAGRESDLLCLLGKHSTKEQRQGLIVVGTQILEQSLDIDFDLLITQLCPMDLFLQRLGRLHRHARPRPAGLQDAVCMVLNQNDPDEGTKAVYGAWLLYRTAQLLPKRITLPNDIAPLVQAVYQDGDQVLPAGDPAFALWQKHQQGIREKERKAQMFRIPDASALMETIHGLLDSSPADSDWVALASVRDGEPSLDVLVMEQRENGEVAFIPWQYAGALVSRDRAPSQEECKHILRQRLQLPSALCKQGMDDVIASLEKKQRQVVPEWYQAPLLQGELFLFLDVHGTAEIGDYQLTYTKEWGLEYRRKEL